MNFFILVDDMGTRFELQKLDAVLYGGFFCVVPASDRVFTETFDYVNLGGPLVSYSRG